MPSVHQLAKEAFKLPVSSLEEFDTHYLLKWTKNTIESQISQNPMGVIKSNGVTFIPIFLAPQDSKNPCSLGILTGMPSSRISRKRK
jgi:hypothetical protein